MDISPETFDIKFHCLQGKTIADKKKQFFGLVQQYKSSFKDDLVSGTILKQLSPTSFLEELLKLELILYLRKAPEVLEILTEGHQIFVGRILKDKWFLKSFEDRSPEDIVNGILPQTSFSVRMKLLGKLSRCSNPKKFDKIFDLVTKRYGIFVASKFICGCSSSKIVDVINTDTVSLRLTSSQIKILYFKDPSLVDLCFSKAALERIDHRSHSRLLKIIFVQNRDLFKSLLAKFGFHFGYGRRITKKILDEQKDTIIENPKNFLHLNIKAVLRKIGKDSIKFFCNALPETYSSDEQISWLFRYFPEKCHHALFFNHVTNHFKIDFYKSPELIPEHLLMLIPENVERSKYAEILVNNGKRDFLKYLEIQKSVGIIKDQLNLAQKIEDRIFLLDQLVQTCYINKNFEQFLDILKFFKKRYSNDDVKVFLALTTSVEYYIDYRELTEEIWSYYIDLVVEQNLKHKDLDFDKVKRFPLLFCELGTSISLAWCYLEFLRKQGKNIQELLDLCFESNVIFPDWGFFPENFDRLYILSGIKNVENFKENIENKEKEEKTSQIFGELAKFNKRYPNAQICFRDFPILAAYFDNQIERHDDINYTVKEEFRKILFTKCPDHYYERYIKLFFENPSLGITHKDLKVFLKNNPETILKYFQNFFELMTKFGFRKQKRLWYLVKKYSHFQIDQRSKNMALSKLKSEDHTTQKSKFMPCISFLMSPEEFASFADSYKPQGKVLDLKDVDEVRLYNIRCTIALALKNFKNWKILETSLGFCMGDYFASARPSLYSGLYRTPELLLSKFLNHLSVQAISVQKHALYLTCELCSVTKIEEAIRESNDVKKVESLQKLIFKSTLKYFVKNPEQQFFDLLKINMFFIKKTDVESLKFISEEMPEKIPENYRAAYFEYTWRFLEKIIDTPQTLQKHKEQLLNRIDMAVYTKISTNLAVDIMQKHLNDKLYIKTINQFIFTLVSVRPKDSTAIFEASFKQLEANTQHDSVKFFEYFYNAALKFQNDLNLVAFVAYFDKKFGALTDFEYQLKLFFLKVKLEFKKENVQQISEKVMDFYAEVIAMHSGLVTPIFAQEMGYAFTQIFHDFDERLLMLSYLTIVERKCDVDVAYLVLNAICKPKNWWADIASFCKVLLKIRESANVGTLAMLYYKYGDYIKSKEFKKLTQT